MNRLAHVERHLRPQVRPFLVPLLEAVTLDAIAVQTNWSRRTVEDAWKEIRAVLDLSDGTGSAPISRLALLRLVLALDPCVCERFAADLEKVS